MGRKPKMTQARSRFLKFRVSEKEDEIFKKWAEESGIPLSELARVAMMREYARWRSGK